MDRNNKKFGKAVRNIKDAYDKPPTDKDIKNRMKTLRKMVEDEVRGFAHQSDPSLQGLREQLFDIYGGKFDIVGIDTRLGTFLDAQFVPILTDEREEDHLGESPKEQKVANGKGRKLIKEQKKNIEEGRKTSKEQKNVVGKGWKSLKEHKITFEDERNSPKKQKNSNGEGWKPTKNQKKNFEEGRKTQKEQNTIIGEGRKTSKGQKAAIYEGRKSPKEQKIAIEEGQKSPKEQRTANDHERNSPKGKKSAIG